MRFAMISLALIFAGLEAGATSLQHTTSAVLTSFHMDAQSPLAQRRILGGSITINFASQEATLILNPAFYCPPNAMCAMVMPRPIEVTLPLKAAYNDRCGTQTYEAHINHLPVDGNLKSLTIKDNTNNRCPHFVALPATEVIFREAGGGRGNFYDYTHTMSGHELQ